MDYIHDILAWVEHNPYWIYSMVALSVVTFIASLILIPWIIIRMPENYFLDEHRHRSKIRASHPINYLLIRIGKNLLGIILILAGLFMFILPGQGILTMLIGISLTDFPGKFQVERWFARQAKILRALNWIRRKAKRPPLQRPK
ncbi:MAG TPA: hypothetical protein ENJ84_14785 [Gammaproteobacteria bacterium]|nr:hypothetical protein [Gammaproteobacteria bacterium]